MYYPAIHRPGNGPDIEHVAVYPGASALVVLLLLHDFPDPGKFPAFACASPSDTLNPHEQLFPGHARSSPGLGLRPGRVFGFCNPLPFLLVLVLSVLLADGDGDHAAVAAAEGVRVGVVGEDGS